MRRTGPLRRREERGVVAIALALISCFVMIPVAALAVDIGVQRVARSDMQSVADVVALDLARKLDGTTTVAEWEMRSPSLQQLADASAAQNDSAVGNETTVVPELGIVDPHTGDFDPLEPGSDEVPNAVRVEASTAVDFAIMGGSGGAARSAVARAETVGCFQLGSFAAALNPASASYPLVTSVLAPLLGNTTLNAISYAGIADSRISLLDLVRAEHIGVGTVSELLELDDLTAADVFLAAASVLAARGEVANANVFQAAAASVVAPVRIDLGDLLGLSTASDAALETEVKVLDLLVGTAFLANGENLLATDNLQAGLASVGVTTTSLQIIEKPQFACDSDQAETAQLKLSSQAKVSIPSNPVYNEGGSRLVLVDNHIALDVNVELAGARGRLVEIACNPDRFEVDVWSELARLGVEGRIHLEGKIALDRNSLPLLLRAGLPSIFEVGVSFDAVIRSDASQPASVTPTRATVEIPPGSYDTPVRVGSGDHVLPNITVALDVPTISTKVVVAGMEISALTDAIMVPLVTPLLQHAVPELSSRVGPLVNPLIAKVNGIVDQLADGLGLSLGGADVYGLPTPRCNSPKLAG